MLGKDFHYYCKYLVLFKESNYINSRSLVTRSEPEINLSPSPSLTLLWNVALPWNVEIQKHLKYLQYQFHHFHHHLIQHYHYC